MNDLQNFVCERSSLDNIFTLENYMSFQYYERSNRKISYAIIMHHTNINDQPHELFSLKMFKLECCSAVPKTSYKSLLLSSNSVFAFL